MSSRIGLGPLKVRYSFPWETAASSRWGPSTRLRWMRAS